jgi:carbon-monoxide dehydrogenase large subunit
MGRFVGAAVRRREDARLLTGRGRYVADLHPPGTAHAAFVRSPYAHARIVSVELSRARAAPGVLFAAAAADLGAILKPQPLFMGGQPGLRPVTPTPLASDRVRYAGEPVAVVVARDRYLAEDAAELARVEYEPLAAAVDPARALEPDAPLVHEALGSNLAAQWRVRVGDVEAAFSAAAHIVRDRLTISRAGGGFMEPRGLLAVPEPTGKLTVWASTQSPHLLQRAIAELLGLPIHQLRVMAPEVGGGFGPKAGQYPEDFLVPWLALRLSCPVVWISDRREDLLSSFLEREQLHEVELAVSGDGIFLALRDRAVADTGAYTPYGAVVAMLTTTSTLGPYKVPNFEAEMRVAYTHRVPVGPVRGAGRPQGAFVMDRMIDLVARRLGLDPAEVRFKNFIQPHEMPYSTGLPFREGKLQTFDSGDYPRCLRMAMELGQYRALRARQEAERQRGRYLGIGIACYVEATSIGPYEGATVRVDPQGKVVVLTGSGPQGQGHETTLAQVCAEELSASMDDVSVLMGDTDAFPFGMGTISSRIATVTSNAVILAARQVREKALALAATLLEANPVDLTLEDGKVSVRGVPERAVTLGQLATLALGRPGVALPPGMRPGLEATEFFYPPAAIFSNGANIAVVEVDPETGQVKLLRYFVAHDCGRVINPLLVEGQIHGGVAHGISNALYEQQVYDERGQPLATTFMDYLLPTAAEIPPIESDHMETPSPLNPAGIKGAGESGTIPAHPAIAAAVEDALAPFGVRIRELPLTPEWLCRLVAEARE